MKTGRYKATFADYGLQIGSEILVKQKDMSEVKYDEWTYAEQRAIVEAETPYFITLTILPHRNPEGYGISEPYPTSIHKHDIQRGFYQLRTIEGVAIN